MRGIKAISQAIYEIEGFKVEFLGDDESLRRRVEEYPFVNAANKAWTVAKWRATRFASSYPDYSVHVLDGYGEVVHGKTLLGTVRDSYYDADEVEDDGGLEEVEYKTGVTVHPGPAVQGDGASTGLSAKPPTPGGIVLAELERRLWDAANALRGPVDPADFKNYVFPMLFWKWLSDSWEWERRYAVQDFGQAVAAEVEADYHRFAVPDGTRWSQVTTKTDNIGARVAQAMQQIEQANASALAGIFGDAAWGNKERLPESALVNLINAFNGVTLDPDHISNDLLGQAYEYLLKNFADESGKKAGEFFTPRQVVHLLVAILDPQPEETVYDPAAGSGGMLVETINAVRSKGGDHRTLRLYAQEVNLTTAGIARMNLFLHDIQDFKVVRGDTLRSPGLRDQKGDLSRFDVVIANPPFSLTNWGADGWAADARSFCGVPPAKNADFAWVQHMLSSMTKQTGRVGVVMPHGVLFRGGLEGRIRQCLVEQDRLEAVIGLPPNLFYSTSIPACLLIFRASKSEERLHHVLFVDGSARFTKGRNQNFMSEDDIDTVLAAYRTDEAIDDDDVHVRLVPFDEIKGNGFDLNIGRYVHVEAEEAVDLATALAAYQEARATRIDAEQRMLSRLAAAAILDPDATDGRVGRDHARGGGRGFDGSVTAGSHIQHRPGRASISSRQRRVRRALPDTG